MCHSWRSVCAMTVVWLSSAAMSLTARAADEVPLQRTFQMEGVVYSIIPSGGLATHRIHGQASISGIAMLDDDVVHGDRHFAVKMTPRFEDGRLVATVVVKPDAADRVTEAFTKTIDLSDFQSQSVELARDTDGRVFRLNIVPVVSTIRQPKQFRVSDLRMENWSVSGSIILNDEEYLGQWSGGSASLAWFEILGVGKVEFSLKHLKDAKPWGTLSGGVVTLRNEDGTKVTINGFTNGSLGQVLPGGPYTVWVRWLPPTMTAEEYRRGMETNIALVKEQIANGHPSFSPETLKQLERMLAADGPKMVMSGMRDVRADEIEP